jgi:hypothetical protein
MQEPEEVVKYIFYLVSALWVSLSFNSCAFSQTLAQTAAYLLSGGYVDLGDIKEVDEDTVRVPGFVLTPMWWYVYPVTVKVTNTPQCEVLTVADGNETPLKEYTVYFNNVIVDEIDVKAISPGLNKFWLKGEDYISCILYRDGNRTCVREYDTTVKTENLERIGKAVTYLYSNFCTTARRKRAF